jgi:hypothetical protein
MGLGFSFGAKPVMQQAQAMQPSPLEASQAMHARVQQHPTLAKGVEVIARTAASIGGGSSFIQQVSRVVILPYLENRKKLGFDEKRKKKLIADLKVFETEATSDKPRDQQ